MSAYMIEREAISFLISAAQHWRSIPYCDWTAQNIGTMLFEENRKSVAHRYPSEPSMASAPPYEWHEPCHVRWNESELVVQVLKTIVCLEYQSCEHPEWDSSPAARWLDRLRSEAITHLPGWDAAEWGAPRPHTFRAIQKSQDERLRPPVHQAVMRDALRLAEAIRKCAADDDVAGVRALVKQIADGTEFARLDEDVIAYVQAARDEAFRREFHSRDGDDENEVQAQAMIQQLVNAILPAAPSIE